MPPIIGAGAGPSVHATVAPNGDLSLNIDAAFPPGMLFMLAGQLTRIANKLMDMQEQQGAMALASLPKDLKRTEPS